MKKTGKLLPMKVRTAVTRSNVKVDVEVLRGVEAKECFLDGELLVVSPAEAPRCG